MHGNLYSRQFSLVLRAVVILRNVITEKLLFLLQFLVTGPQADFLRNVELKKKQDYEAIRHLKYDPSLILPKLTYPNKMPAFTVSHRSTTKKLVSWLHWSRYIHSLSDQEYSLIIHH